MLLRNPSTNGLGLPTAKREAWGWSGSVPSFLGLEQQAFLAALTDHYVALTGEAPSASQIKAWLDEREALQSAFREIGREAATWNLVFEYELPFEGGRRPDVVTLAGESVIVLEFKGSPIIGAAFIDQVEAYARDLSEYHEASHWRDVFPILVSTSRTVSAETVGSVVVCNPESLADAIQAKHKEGAIDFEEWLNAPYAPLPSLVSAARRLFQHEDLPHVRRALAARIPETVKLVDDLVLAGRRQDRRRLVLVTGVPGAGKTLVGLRIVYERAEATARSTFLSGNGPLVKVLQDALSSRVFVRDLHKFITSYGQITKPPEQDVIVFDEAQRAWDRAYMLEKKGVDASEPELLLDIAGRVPGSATLVGLVGTGQSIYSGEEGGLELWRSALESAEHTWEIFGPGSVASSFAALDFTTEDDLDLDVSLRFRQAEDLHDWVSKLLDGNLGAADEAATAIDRSKFPMYVTRDLDEAREYARRRYAGEPDPRYGLVASSHATNLEALGVNNSWIFTSRTNLAKWFNAGPEDPKSCCALVEPVTEFGCQGLELDLPILCWGTDLAWQGNGWVLRPKRRKYPIEDPEALLRNTYRVLLTRGRDGIVIWVPPGQALDETASALELAGVSSHWTP